MTLVRMLLLLDGFLLLNSHTSEAGMRMFIILISTDGTSTQQGFNEDSSPMALYCVYLIFACVTVFIPFTAFWSALEMRYTVRFCAFFLVFTLICLWSSTHEVTSQTIGPLLCYTKMRVL